jgi:hypothetical protein
LSDALNINWALFAEGVDAKGSMMVRSSLMLGHFGAGEYQLWDAYTRDDVVGGVYLGS